MFLKDHYIRFLPKLPVSIFVPHSSPHSRVFFNISDHITHLTPSTKIKTLHQLLILFLTYPARSLILTLCDLTPVSLTNLILSLSLDFTVLKLHSVFDSLSTKTLFLCMGCFLCLALHAAWNAHHRIFTVSLAIESWFPGTISHQSTRCCSLSQSLLRTFWYHNTSFSIYHLKSRCLLIVFCLSDPLSIT